MINIEVYTFYRLSLMMPISEIGPFYIYDVHMIFENFKSSYSNIMIFRSHYSLDGEPNVKIPKTLLAFSVSFPLNCVRMPNVHVDSELENEDFLTAVI